MLMLFLITHPHRNRMPLLIIQRLGRAGSGSIPVSIAGGGCRLAGVVDRLGCRLLGDDHRIGSRHGIDQAADQQDAGLGHAGPESRAVPVG